MRLLWYGCSWVEGVRKDIIPFPNLVSQNLNLEYENRGQCATSIDCMVARFSKDYTTDKLKQSDVVIFCTTSSYRIRWDLHFKFGIKAVNDENQKSWLLHFANDDITSFLAFRNLSLLYFMSKSMNIRCFFVNSFYPLKQQNSNLIPPKNWLMPFDKSCVDILEFPIVKPYPVVSDSPDLLNDTWRKQKNQIEKYLIPNDNHPNQLGNETISNYLTTKLKESLCLYNV